jgi:broad specificity phosphatase PhoE
MTTSSTDLFLIRHGARLDFENPGWRETAERPHDSPLSPTGQDQVRRTAETLAGSGIRWIYASPFLRTLQTATALADRLDLPIRIEQGFSEWLNPVWMPVPPRLLPAADACALFPRIEPGYASITPPVHPEHDERVEVMARVAKTLDVLRQRHAREPIAVISHGSPLGQACGYLLKSFDGIVLKMASITHIAWSPTTCRLVSSSTAHLPVSETEIKFHAT